MYNKCKHSAEINLINCITIGMWNNYFDRNIKNHIMNHTYELWLIISLMIVFV